MTGRIVFSVSVLTVLFFHSIAQPFIDIISVSGMHSRGFEKPDSDSSFRGTDYLSAELSLPFKIKKDILAISPSWTELNIHSVNTNDLKIRSVSIPLAYVRQWKNENQKTNFVFIIRSNQSEKAGAGNSAFQFGGAVIHTIKKSENLKFKLGAYYNSEFFGPFILPLAGIDWTINDRLNLYGVLPGSMNLEYFINKRFSTGINFRSYTASYRLGNDHFIRINDNHLKVLMDFYLFPKHILSLEAGHSALRKYRTGIRADGKNVYVGTMLTDGYLIKFSYSYRIRFKER